MGKLDWPLEGIDVEDVEGIIARSSQLFHGFVKRAEQALCANKPHAVTAWAQIAADIAWNSHAGLYCSPPLENMLLQVAQDIGRFPSSLKNKLPAGGFSRRKVLHVLSFALPTGGHTRVVERWIRNAMNNETHSIIIDGIGNPPPQWLTHAAEASGGRLLMLDLPFQSLLQKAVALRQMAHEWADLIILHTNPYDPLPILAFGVDSGPPVVFFNHADHVFWLGASIADIIADLRPAGQTLTMQRRGKKETVLLPIPLVQPRYPVDRSEARKYLGLDERATVILTIASGYKYAPLGGFDFLELHSRVLMRHPDTVLLAVGPSDSGRWAEFRTATNGRIRAFGEQNDLSYYHAAADIYVDSFPFASLTSMFEVGLLGKPLIGLSNPLSPIHSGNDISLISCSTHLATREEYEEGLSRLITDIPFREVRGKEVAQAIQEDHASPGWNTSMRKLVEAVPAKHSAALLPDLQQKPDENDIFLACIQQAGGMSDHVYSFLGKHIRYLPAASRYSLAFDNLLQKGIFSERKLRMKAFRSYSIPSSKQLMQPLKKWWQRTRMRITPS